MIVHLCLLLNLVVFLIVNCLDDPPPPRPRPRPQPIIVQQPGRGPRRQEKSERSLKPVKEKKINIPVPKPTEPKMRPRECNDNETVEETQSQWGSVDATFVRSPARGHKKKKSRPSY